jgi:2-keto-4-pentenoate hydratase/2-oxohepta-3-ene-1,7-dioic acid hydratase in catechol pathway
VKLVLFDAPNGDRRFGRVEGDEIVDLSGVIDPRGPCPLGQALGDIQKVESADGRRHAVADVALRPPALGARNVLAVGVNYAGHARVVAARNGVDFDPDAKPALFTKSWSSLVGHGSPIVRPAVSTQFDFEGELAVIIGKHCRSVSRERARDVVGGYAIGMDGSIRDWQRALPTPLAGKNFASTGGLGPWLVTPDEAGNPSAMRLTTHVNGEVMQDAPVSDLLNDIPTLIEHITTFMPLEPGDVIFTGTPEGCRADRGNTGWLVPGDEVSVEVSGVGRLVHTVVDE